MTEAWRYELSPRAQRDLRRLDLVTRERVLAALDRLIDDPFGSDQRKLQGTDDERRLRVSDWRVRFRRDAANRTIVVLQILPRDRAYRD